VGLCFPFDSFVKHSYRSSLQLADLVSTPFYNLHDVFPGGKHYPFTTNPPYLPEDMMVTLDDVLERCRQSAEGLVRLSTGPIVYGREEERSASEWKIARVLTAPVDAL